MEILLGCFVFAEVLMVIVFAHRIGHGPNQGWQQYC